MNFWIIIISSYICASGDQRGVAPNLVISSSLRCGTSSSSSAGMAVSSRAWPSSAASPTSPPRNTFTPSTAMYLPVSSLNFFAGEPISPMSPTCAWPHELGQPVQCRRTRRGNSSSVSRRLATRTARAFVSTRPWPHPLEPVQDTTPRMSEMPRSTRIPPRLSSGASSRAATRPLSTLGRTTFCSTVSRISPSENSSARSASSRKSVGVHRPAGTVMPTHDFPSCRCGCTPMMSRRANVPSCGGAARRSGSTPRASSRSFTRWRNQSKPFASSSQSSRVFCRSAPRSPWSRNTSSTAAENSAASSARIHASNGIASAARLMEK
mmetsp:Transcript_14223/g.36827  ORF Transcript_14223/g.36827 Transcript_14223/m.36827 type:complete len:323 (-) Transcript_14223:878-1846(-)